MALKIRLARGGAKKRPYYRIVVADSRSPRDGRFIEHIGAWNPMLPRDHENRVQIDADKANSWLRKGARPTDRVARFLSHIHVKDLTVAEGEQGPSVEVVEEGAKGARPLFGWKPSNNPKKAEPGQKAKERIEEKKEKEEAKKAAAEEAKAAPAEAEAAPAEEAPAEEAPAEEEAKAE